MDITQLYDYCLSLKGTSESFPFDEETLVFKVAGKMFALAGLEYHPATVSLKCDPEKAEDLRARYNAIQPGYHMNKKHWNTVVNHSDVNDKLLKQMIDESYNLVIQGLPKKTKLELGL